MFQELKKKEFITLMCRVLKSGKDYQGVVIGCIALKRLVFTVKAFNLRYASLSILLYI